MSSMKDFFSLFEQAITIIIIWGGGEHCSAWYQRKKVFPSKLDLEWTQPKSSYRYFWEKDNWANGEKSREFSEDCQDTVTWDLS